jgi:hypothetical protein
MAAHALLSPSSAYRWLNCTPSARLEAKYPDKAGQAAREGTLAHWLGETLIGYALKTVKLKTYNAVIAEIQKNELYTPAMMEYAEGYASFVLERYALALAVDRHAVIQLETKTKLDKWVKESFGTLDVRIASSPKLTVIDLKFGKGKEVSAERNAQLMTYAIGILDDYELEYDIKTVEMIIYQPRIDNVSIWEISVEELREWAVTVLKPQADIAFEGKGEFKPGAHCDFCRAAGNCKALADYNLELARHEFAEPVTLSDTDTVEILNRKSVFEKWIKAVSDYALDQAVNHSKQWPGMKVVEGKSNRVYSNPALIAETLLKAQYAETDIFKTELKGITELEKEIGKSEFGRLLSDLIVKPEGKPTLVPESDKRPAFKGKAGALSDFGDDLD